MADEPDLRFLQANERTLLAWVRTGLTLMAFGFVVARLSVWLHLEHPERGSDSMGAWLGIAIVALPNTPVSIALAAFRMSVPALTLTWPLLLNAASCMVSFSRHGPAANPAPGRSAALG